MKRARKTHVDISMGGDLSSGPRSLPRVLTFRVRLGLIYACCQKLIGFIIWAFTPQNISF